MSIASRSLQKNLTVGVIGSGISGLSFTYFLSQLRPDLNFIVFEKQKEVGGYIHSETKTYGKDANSSLKKSVILEKGPRTLRGSSDGTLLILDTLLKLGQKEKIYAVHSKSPGNKKYLLSYEKNSNDEALTEVPNSVETLFKFLFSSLTKYSIINIFLEMFRKKKKDFSKDESIEAFFKRRFDKYLNENIASAMIHGIYAGDTSKLSFQTIMPKLAELEKTDRSILLGLLKQNYKAFTTKKLEKSGKEECQIELSKNLKDYSKYISSPSIPFINLKKFLKNYPIISFKETGISILTKVLYENLKKNPKVKFLFEQDIESISKNENGKLSLKTLQKVYELDHIRSTINSHSLASLISTSLLAKDLQKLNYSDILLVNLFIPKNLLYTEGFGYLVPKSSILKHNYLLGCIFDSSIEKHSFRLFENNRLLVNLINYPKIKQEEINSLTYSDFSKKKPADLGYTKLTLMYGGIYNKEVLSQSYNQLFKKVNKILEDQFNIDLNVYKDENGFILEKTVIENCIPQYEVGYNDLYENVMKNLQSEFEGKLSIGGMSFNKAKSIGVPDCFMDSFESSIELK
ncbi:hypothetical protein PACTADRAFT_78270 [Pachysolen tannophilus NRRL Y-2460]|uniref:Protoporphyrinogen oxidase n=1 Tax=Pachysolen tannophilus NRRL Y-2460 TaxID=669874 RepID=A0A1E4U1Q1_PACTA|nr:hypothetical protein PACTADRAFT_78270 [Pachysolen tannophilus NRRL Y-2460]